MDGTSRSVAQRVARAVNELAYEEVAGQGPDRHPSLFEPRQVPLPLAGLRAARTLLRELQQQVREQVLLARGLGEDWEDIAAALGLLLEPDGRPDACAAYLTAVGTAPSSPWWAPAAGVAWLCGACEEAVRDFGPACGAPGEREHGHASNCARHVAEQLAWEALWR